MTNVKLYAKIIFMKIVTDCKRKFLILTLLLSAVIFIISAFSLNFFSVLGVIENATVQSEKFLPITDLEYKDLSSPIDTYSDNSVTTIAQETQTLLVYYNGKYQEQINGFTAIKQVLKLDENTLLVSDAGSIYKIHLDQIGVSGGTVKSALIDSVSNNNIGGNFFDLNEQYLVTAYSTTATVYSHSGTEFSSLASFTIKDNVPIAINDNNEIFYVTVDGLYKLSTNNISLANGVRILSGISPDRMIANNEFVYYIDNSEIYRVPVTGGQSQKLIVNDIDAKFELGKLSAPSGISFKGDNLLISDSTLGTVQEFKIQDGTLVFTGFAIAKGKTAFNRVNGTAPNAEVEKYGDTVAVLDNYKLTVINTANANRYSRDNFKNYFSGSDGVLGEYMPDSFALGKTTALLVYKTGTSDATVKLLDINNGNVSSTFNISESPVIRDVCYQSGTYYILSDNGGTSTVYAFNENDFNFSDGQIIYTTTDVASVITVDTFNTIFLTNGTNVYIVKKATEGNNLGLYVCTETVFGFNSITKLGYDLSGGLYLLNSGKITYYANGQTLVEFSNDASMIKAFAMDYIDDRTFILCSENEFLSVNTELENVTLSDLTVPADFILHAQNADVKNLKAYKASDGANTYIMERAGEKFSFKGLSSKNSEYLYICSITATNEYGISATLYALADEECLIFIDQNQAVEAEISITDCTVDTVAFTRTKVDGYYLPIITRTGSYQLINSENATVKLNAAQSITPLYSFTFLNNEFYYASFTVDGKDYYGYIPKDYTVDVLYKDFVWDEYSIDTVNKTTLYQDATLKTSIKTLKDGTSVRIISKNNDVLKVAVKDGEEWLVGYIKASALNNEPQKSIRNILIILAVVACVCGTSTYFVLRKKNHV